VEELMSGESGSAQLCRKYNMLQYALPLEKAIFPVIDDRFNNELAQEGTLRDRQKIWSGWWAS